MKPLKLVRHQIRTPPQDQAWAQVQAQAWSPGQASSEIVRQVWDQVRGQVNNQIWALSFNRIRTEIRS